MMRWNPTCLAAAWLLALPLAGCSSEPAAELEASQVACDRACLLSLADAYVAGLAAHDASALPLAEDFAIVENAERIEPGAGLWATATGGATGFALPVPDEAAQTVGWLGVIENEGKPVELGLRLELEDGRIVRAEHRWAEVSEPNLARLQTPRPGMLDEVPPEQRLDRATLVRIGGSYYDAVDDNDGTKMPFAEDCQRQENGMVTAGEGAGQGPASRGFEIARDCAGQLSSGVMAYISTIDDRQVFAADPVTGLVMGFSILRHTMDFDSYPVTGVDGTTIAWGRDRFDYDPFDNLAAHVWKIGPEGQVHQIEAVGRMLGHPLPDGWTGEAKIRS